MDKPFRIARPAPGDKEFLIMGPRGFNLIVDYDDVDHRLQMRTARLVTQVLNENWDVTE